MLNKVIDYKIVSVTEDMKDPAGALEKTVKTMMTDNWVPSGMPVHLGEAYCQTMLKFG